MAEITIKDLLAKIGELTVSNEVLTKENEELHAVVRAIRADANGDDGSERIPTLEELGLQQVGEAGNHDRAPEPVESGGGGSSDDVGEE